MNDCVCKYIKENKIKTAIYILWIAITITSYTKNRRPKITSVTKNTYNYILNVNCDTSYFATLSK